MMFNGTICEGVKLAERQIQPRGDGGKWVGRTLTNGWWGLLVVVGCVEQRKVVGWRRERGSDDLKRNFEEGEGADFLKEEDDSLFLSLSLFF